jgi:hypothetical protein
LSNEQWAAKFGDSTTNNNIKHDNIMRILDRHASRRKRSSITDQEVEKWIADDEWKAQNAAAMNIANVQWGLNTNTTKHPPLGTVPSTHPDSTFRMLSVQINNLSVSRRKNIKAAMLQWLIKRY